MILKQSVKITIFLVMCCSVLLLNSCSSNIHISPPQLQGGRDFFVTEPVFNGKVYIYEAGLEHENSVVLVPGIGDDGVNDWGYLIPELAKQYHVVAFDLPGVGRSAKQNVLYSPENYTAFVKWAVSRYVKGTFILIGHSLGGAVALSYAAAYPNDLQKLILVDVFGILHRTALTGYVVQIKSIHWRSRLLTRLSIRPVHDLNDFLQSVLDSLEFQRATSELETAVNSPAFRKLVLGSDSKKIAALALVLEDYSQVLERVTTPAFILWGDKDPVAPLRTGKVLAAQLANAQLEIITESGHIPMLEQKEKFNQIVLKALSSNPVPKRSAIPVQQQPVITGNMGRCNNQDGIIFNGFYENIEIVNCQHVKIVDVTANMISISGSEVMIENSLIKSNDVSLRVVNSELELTNVYIEADVAIETSDSRLDLAGVKLVGRKFAVQAKDGSSLLFSVSHVESPYTSGYLHGLRKVSDDKPL